MDDRMTEEDETSPVMFQNIFFVKMFGFGKKPVLVDGDLEKFLCWAKNQGNSLKKIWEQIEKSTDKQLRKKNIEMMQEQYTVKPEIHKEQINWYWALLV